MAFRLRNSVELRKAATQHRLRSVHYDGGCVESGH